MEKLNQRIIIDGTIFFVDYQGQQFIQASQKENKISFSALERHPNMFLLNYNTQTKNAIGSYKKLIANHGNMVVSIHKDILSFPQKLMDRKGFCKEHNVESYKETKNVLLIDENIGNRLEGQLPKIKVGRNIYDFQSPFLFKNKQSQTVHTLDHNSVIYVPAGDKFLGLFDVGLNEVISLARKKIEIKSTLKVFEIPYHPKFDPIGEAMLRGIENTSLLCSYPQKKYIVAPLSNLDNQIHHKMLNAGVRFCEKKNNISAKSAKSKISW